MTAIELLRSSVSSALRKEGFRKRRDNWYRTTLELYAILNIQASTWGEGNYINFGFSPRARTDAEWIPERHCLVRLGIEAVMGADIEATLVLSAKGRETLSLAAQEDAIRAHIVPVILQVMVNTRTVDDLAHLLATTDMAFVHKDVKSLLSS